MALSVRMWNVVVLGFCFMFVFTAFQTGGLIQKNVIDSIRNETGGAYQGDGYVSLSVVYGVFALCNWIAPSIIALISPRASMFIGAITYNIFISQFLYPTTAGLYIASALVGLGAAVIWTGQGTFLTQNSTKETMSRNSGIFWAMMQLSLIWGNIFVFFNFNDKNTIDAPTRNVVYGALTVVGVLGNALMLLFRKPPRDESTTNENEDDEKPPFIKGVADSFRLLKTPNMLLLSVAFIYTGLELSFFSGVYSACIGFTKAFGHDSQKYVPISGIVIGVGEVLSGLAFSIFDKYTKRIGRARIVSLGLVAHMIAFSLAFLNLPDDSPFTETTAPARISSSIGLALLGSFLLGFGDGCFNTQVYSIIGAMYSENSAPAFGLFKFMQSIAAAAAFYSSIHLYLPAQLGILAVFAGAGTACFVVVARRVSVYTKVRSRTPSAVGIYDQTANAGAIHQNVTVD